MMISTRNIERRSATCSDARGKNERQGGGKPSPYPTRVEVTLRVARAGQAQPLPSTGRGDTARGVRAGPSPGVVAAFPRQNLMHALVGARTHHSKYNCM